MADLDGIAAVALRLLLPVFMGGSLRETGLGPHVTQALKGRRDPLFLGHGVVFGFLIGPLLAWVLTRRIRLEQSHSNGLLLRGFPGA